MGIDILLIISALPIILMCAYVYSKDKDKEPTRTLRKLFLYGVFSIVPIVILEILASKVVVFDKNNIVSLFINTFITIGLIEEGSKWVIVNKSIYNDIEFNHAYDAIIYCVFASLGFAFVENLLYVFDQGITVAILRGLTTIPAHTFNGIIMGYFLGLCKKEDINKNNQLSKKYMFLSLIIPILAHTIYDYFLLLETNFSSVMFIIFVVIMYIISFKIINNISLINKNFDGSNYNSKKRIKYVETNELFVHALSNVFIITLILLFTSSVIMIFSLNM